MDFSSYDWQSSSGDNNTCDNPDGWNDEGTIGCTYSCNMNINNTQINLIDPPLGTPVCINTTTNITANITIKALSQNLVIEINNCTKFSQKPGCLLVIYHIV